LESGLRRAPDIDELRDLPTQLTARYGIVAATAIAWGDRAMIHTSRSIREEAA
jgi:hypothetical protein